MKSVRLPAIIFLLFLFPVPFLHAQGQPKEGLSLPAPSLNLLEARVPGSDIRFNLRHDGLEREYIVHVPEAYSRAAFLPVVFAIHGGGGDAEHSAAYFGLNAKADQEGFLVVYPQGTGKKTLGKTWGAWNAGQCCTQSARTDVDDVGFFKKMIARLDTDFRIDRKRIYATGMSNGALMAYRLACDLSESIAAIAVSGAHSAYKECHPSRPVPVLHFHGSEDRCAPVEGGQCGGCFAEFFNGMGIPVQKRYWDCSPLADYIKEWSRLDGCADRTEVTYQQGRAVCRTYQDCREGAEVTLCLIDGMGHTWPGRTSHSVKACQRNPDGLLCRHWKNTVGELSADINANEMLWEFFKKHPLP